MASKHPQISWLFLATKQQNFFLVFHSDFGCLEGGGGKHPPPRHLTYIFNPVPNRVNLHLLKENVEFNYFAELIP